MGRSDIYRLTTSQLAARQHGHVARRQLLARGVPATTVAGWIRHGWLISAHVGVYAVGYRRVEPVARAMAAVLACGDGAVLSHDSALALWGLRRWNESPFEVTVVGDRRPRGITVHRTVTLTPADTTVQLGVPVTRAARALRDMRPRLTARQRTRLANDARLKRIVGGDEFAALVGHGRNPTRSGLEDAFQRFLQRFGLPQPLINVTVNGHEVDAYYPRERVIVQIDHFATHGDPVSFAADRELDASDLACGDRVVRLTRFTVTEARRLRRIVDSSLLRTSL